MGMQDTTTWAVGGSSFVALYAATLMALLAAVLWTRRSDHPSLDPAAGDRLDEYDVAMVNGGERLACVVALVNLDRRGALELGDRLLRELARSHNVKVDHLTRRDLRDLGVGATVTLLREVPVDADPVEQAVYEAVREVEPRTPEAIIAAAHASSALAALRSRLARLGLVEDADEVTRYRHQWRWFVPLLVLGVAHLAEASPGDEPVAGVIGLLVGTVIGMWAVGRQRAPAVRRRRRLIEELRKRRDLASEASGRGGDAMSLALLGPGALWWADRPLALALGTDGPRESLASTSGRSSWRSKASAIRARAGRGWVGRASGAWGGGGCGGDGGGGAGGGGGGCGGGGCGGGESCGGGGCGGGG